jgi:hypothetical protein
MIPASQVLSLTGVNDMAERIVYRAEFFKEGDVYVGLAPGLNVSSFGETLDDARRCL